MMHLLWCNKAKFTIRIFIYFTLIHNCHYMANFIAYTSTNIFYFSIQFPIIRPEELLVPGFNCCASNLVWSSIHRPSKTATYDWKYFHHLFIQERLMWKWVRTTWKTCLQKRICIIYSTILSQFDISPHLCLPLPLLSLFLVSYKLTLPNFII